MNGKNTRTLTDTFDLMSKISEWLNLTFLKCDSIDSFIKVCGIGAAIT